MSATVLAFARSRCHDCGSPVSAVRVFCDGCIALDEAVRDHPAAYLGRSEAVVRACSPASEQGVDVDSARPASTPDHSEGETK